ncbi:hypothetical protein [Collinsella sp. An268]|uniref:hypothetical protein n=1 Tax=Collinsella sp. An268 TaxID=1965612 RepID=UPI0019D18FB5|nr:hypothetical protein [Collinsella sp. An268]
MNVYFPDIDIKELRAAIDERLKREGFFINGYSLSNLILHIAIALERCLNRFPAFDSGYPVAGQTTSEVDRVTEDILGAIEENYLVTFSEADRRSLKLILSTCLVDVDSLEDARRVPFTSAEIQDALVHVGRVGIMPGETYGEGGLGYLRMCIGGPRSKVEEGLARMKMAFDALYEKGGSDR